MKPWLLVMWFLQEYKQDSCSSKSQRLKLRRRNDVRHVCEINVHYLYPKERKQDEQF